MPSLEQRAVSVLVERAQLLAVRQRAQPAEQVERRHRHPHLRAARQREVVVACEQAAHRVLDRHQRGRARGVDGVGGPHQIETVGDAPDDDVGDQPGNGFGSERGQHLLQLHAQTLELLLRAPRIELAQQIQRLADDQAALQRHRIAAVQVGALAEDDRRARAHLVRELRRAGVCERVGRDLQREPLVGLAPDRDRRNPVRKRVEPRERAEITAALAVGLVGVSEVGVVVDVGVPRLRRRVRGRVDPPEDVAPVGVEVAGAGEQARHADDRDAALLALRGHQTLAPARRFSACVPTPTTSWSSARSRPSAP